MIAQFKKHKYTAKALRYAFKVIKGHRPACSYEIKACHRFVDDLHYQKRYEYSITKAERACRFMEKMPHTKGKWAAQKKDLRLEDWQCFIFCNLFGWVNAGGFRRFRDCYLKIPRKNGKSMISAALGVFMFTMDGEYGAEVYSGATTMKQAWEVFGPGRQMLQRLPALRCLPISSK